MSEDNNQPNQNETAQPEPKPAPVDRVSRSLSELLASEKQTRETRVAEKQEARAQAELEALKKQLAEDPLAVLQSQGVSYDQLTQRVLESGGPNPTEFVKQEVGRLEQLIRERDEAERRAAQQRAIVEAEREVMQFVQNNKEFPLLNAMGMQGAVFDRVIASIENGQPISEEEAAREVEAHLSSVLEQALGNEDIRSKYLPEPEPQQIQLQPPTLTQDMATTPSKPVSTKPMTDDERHQAFAAMLRFKTKG